MRASIYLQHVCVQVLGLLATLEQSSHRISVQVQLPLLIKQLEVVVLDVHEVPHQAAIVGSRLGLHHVYQGSMVGAHVEPDTLEVHIIVQYDVVQSLALQLGG
jgi:hypothetical protein